MIGILKLSCIFVAGAVFDTQGRRRLMFCSCAGMGTAMLLLAGRMYSLQDSLPDLDPGEEQDPCNTTTPSDVNALISSPAGAHTDEGVALPMFALCLYMASFSLGMGAPFTLL